MKRVTPVHVSVVLGLAVAIAACTASPSVSPSASPSASTQQVATLDLAYDAPAVVGASAQATVSGLPSGKTVDLTWGTVTGGWVIEDYYYFRGKKYSETTTSLGKLPGRRQWSPECAVHHSRRLRRRARSDRAHRWQAGRAECHQPHADFLDHADVGPSGHGHRAEGHRTRVAHDGKHVGGELGQPGAGVCVCRQLSWFRGRALPCHRTARQSRRQAVYRLARTRVSELRTVTGCRFAASAIHISHDTGHRRSSRARRTVSAAADPKGRSAEGWPAGVARAIAGSCRHARAAQG